MAAINLTISAVLAIIVGILVLAAPKLFRWVLGLYLIIAGILQILL
jgi:uncharacterized membrane protein HdeD (DUF308 family)